MKYWLLIVGVWLAVSGAIAASLVLALGFPFWGALLASGVVGAWLCWFFLAREVEAEDLKMRESTWNMPDDEFVITKEKD